MLDEAGETAGVVAVGGYVSAFYAALGGGFILHAGEAAAVDGAVYARIHHLALADAHIVTAGGIVAQLACKAAYATGSRSIQSCVFNLAAMETEASQGASDEAAYASVRIGGIRLYGAAAVGAIGERGILRNARKSGGEALTSDVTRSVAVRE